MVIQVKYYPKWVVLNSTARRTEGRIILPKILPILLAVPCKKFYQVQYRWPLAPSKTMTRWYCTTYDTPNTIHRPWIFAVAHHLGVVYCIFISCRCCIAVSICMIINDIMSCNYMQKSTETDEYWSFYSSAKFGFEFCHRSIELRWAESPSISVRCRRFLRVNGDQDVDYRLCNREVSGKRMKESARVIVMQHKTSHIDTHMALTLRRHNIFQ